MQKSYKFSQLNRIVLNIKPLHKLLGNECRTESQRYLCNCEVNYLIIAIYLHSFMRELK
jgi:hypothetical protein